MKSHNGVMDAMTGLVLDFEVLTNSCNIRLRLVILQMTSGRGSTRRVAIAERTLMETAELWNQRRR